MEKGLKFFTPSSNMQFEFTDLIAGYVKEFDKETGSFTLTTSDGREFRVAVLDRRALRALQCLQRALRQFLCIHIRFLLLPFPSYGIAQSSRATAVFPYAVPEN